MHIELHYYATFLSSDENLVVDNGIEIENKGIKV